MLSARTTYVRMRGTIQLQYMIYEIYKFQTGWDYAGHLDCVSGHGILSILSGLSRKNRDRWSPQAHSLLFLKSTKGATRLNVPIRRTNRYQQYYMPSQHIYCRRVWNLIQGCDVQSSNQKVYISTPPSSEVENLLPRRGSNSRPGEPEADMLPSEPVRRVVI